MLGGCTVHKIRLKENSSPLVMIASGSELCLGLLTDSLWPVTKHPPV